MARVLGILEDIKSCTNEERDMETGHTGAARRRILDANGISVLAGQVIQQLTAVTLNTICTQMTSADSVDGR